MARIAEILPGFLAWSTIILLFFASWKLPFYVAYFIVLFDLYWFLKTAYFYINFIIAYKKLRQTTLTNWMDKLQKEFQDKMNNIFHLVIFPMYKESYDVAKDSLEALLNVDYNKDKFIVVLALEERGGEEDQKVGIKLKQEFENKFFKFIITTHPKDIPGELAGKGSNETFAIKQVKKEIIDVYKIPYENIIVSSFDIDTIAAPQYFSLLTYKFLENNNGIHCSYQPIPLFISNFKNTNLFSKIVGFTATFWQLMVQYGKTETMTTFSSHSMPFKPLVDINYWPVNVISEDSQIFFKLKMYDAQWSITPLFYPIYMHAVDGQHLLEALKNIYKQQRRWAWGIENIVFIFKNLFNKTKMSLMQNLKWLLILLSGFYSWAMTSLIILVLGFLPIILGGNNFGHSVVAYNLPRITGLLMNFASIGIIISAFFSIKILSNEKYKFNFKDKLIFFSGWILLPIILILFGSFPALDAQTRMMLGGKFKLDFWKTPKYKK
ncbi:MAG: glycosyltransferase [Minisyncoccia bacterium]